MLGLWNLLHRVNTHQQGFHSPNPRKPRDAPLEKFRETKRRFFEKMNKTDKSLAGEEVGAGDKEGKEEREMKTTPTEILQSKENRKYWENFMSINLTHEVLKWRIFFLRHSSALVTQAGMQWYSLSSLKPPPLGSSDSPASAY
ncbi:hypothetical protein AAY473_011537 [Plecturocebus cupreus]